MDRSLDPAPRQPAEVLAEWRRLERLLADSLDEDERRIVQLRIEELKAEYRHATQTASESVGGGPTLDLADGNRGLAI